VEIEKEQESGIAGERCLLGHAGRVDNHSAAVKVHVAGLELDVSISTAQSSVHSRSSQVVCPNAVLW
jgi:hypothetical protein